MEMNSKKVIPLHRDYGFATSHCFEVRDEKGIR